MVEFQWGSCFAESGIQIEGFDVTFNGEDDYIEVKFYCLAI